nr:MAG TPA: hypothetical protein [Caudoviricetes sp.]
MGCITSALVMHPAPGALYLNMSPRNGDPH